MRRVVLVTGASSGIGRSVARVLSARGFAVYGSSRRVSHGEELDGFRMVQMDVNSESSVQSAIGYILQCEGQLHAVINNAGLGMVGPVESISDAEVREIFDTNVFGVLNVCRASIPYLREAGGGHIINITSIAGLMGLPFRGIYSSSKFAVEGFTESLSQEVQQFGIRVSLIEPGDFRTNINENRRVAGSIHESYRSQSEETLAQVSLEVSNAPDPEQIGFLAERILNTRRPRLRYKAATPFQRFSVFLKRVLPDRWFEFLVMKRYRLHVKD